MEDGTLRIGTLGAGIVHAAPRDTAAPRTRFRAASYAADEGKAVEVAWNGADAWFETTAADLRYRWRLDGGRWCDVTAATTARLTPAPGTHSLQVQAIDRFGNAEDPPAAVAVTVRPRSGFPYLPVGAAGAALLLAGYFIGRRVRRTGS